MPTIPAFRAGLAKKARKNGPVGAVPDGSITLRLGMRARRVMNRSDQQMRFAMVGGRWVGAASVSSPGGQHVVS